VDPRAERLGSEHADDKGHHDEEHIARPCVTTQVEPERPEHGRHAYGYEQQIAARPLCEDVERDSAYRDGRCAS